MEGDLGMHSLTKELEDIFEESENDRTFYGFSDSENSNFSKGSDSEGGQEAKPEPTSTKQPVHPFRLRIALRSRSSIHHSTDEEEEETKKEEEGTKERALKKDTKSKRKTIKKERRVKFEEEEKPVAQAFVSKSGSGSDGDEYGSFLDKRALNIKANKAMLAQLMADLQKMPGGGGLLKKQASKKPKERGPRPPRSSMDRGESRKNPDRASRRRTRSMGGGEGDDSPAPKEELELSLEEELLEVRGAPRRRGTPRPKQSKPHIIRPAEDITEDEIQLVADAMTEKVYNRVSGTTCHQCRQKTVDTKTFCRSEDCRGIQGQFCGPCLRNRYGEDVKKALRDPDWQCPPCRGICNCSFCRQREGRCPTGILFPLAQYHGFSDVHSYLSSLCNKLKKGEDEAEADEDL